MIQASKFASTLLLFATSFVAACAGNAATQADTRAAKVVFVAGATGGTGKEVVKQALDKGYAVRALVRDEARARELFGDTVTYVVGDVRETETLPGLVAGADYVVSALGSNQRRDPTNKPELIDYGGVKALAEASKAAGVKHFVLISSMGVTDPNHMLNKILDNILVWKKKGEDALRDSGVPYTVVRPGGLNDEPGGTGGFKVMQGDPQVMGLTPRADVASVVVAAIGRKDALSKTFEIVGDPNGTPPDWNTFFAQLTPDVR